MRIYLFVGILAIFSLAIATDQSVQPESAASAVGMVGAESMTTIGGKGETSPGMINRDPTKAMSELGELYYPGARILNSLVCYGGGPEDVMVLMSTNDDLDKVKAYYNPKFTGKEVTHTEGPRYYSLLRPERATEPVGTPPAYITMLQDYAGKEVIITVFQGYCAYEHFNKSVGHPLEDIKQNTDFRGGFGWDND
jgi:hypothetical protein